jgi:hypothetical protein
VARGPAAGGVEQLRRQVEPDDLGATNGGLERDVAGAGGDVEHRVSGLDVHVSEEVARRRLVDDLSHGRVVTCGPGGAMNALEFCNGGHANDGPGRPSVRASGEPRNL